MILIMLRNKVIMSETTNYYCSLILRTLIYYSIFVCVFFLFVFLSYGFRQVCKFCELKKT